MAKLKSERIRIDGSEKGEVDFIFDINVDKEGNFTTTLPPKIVELFEAAGISMRRNRINNLGFFSHITCDGLIKEIKEVSKEYVSRELIFEKIFIRYSIQTTCAYCIENGVIFPNRTFVEDEDNKETEWRNGTVTQNATSPNSFGFQIYAKPFWKRVYKYKSGKQKTDYDEITGFGDSAASEKQIFLKLLEGFTTISVPWEGKIQEVEYNEYVAAFFVNLLRSVCMINEKIKDFIDPDSIKIMAENKQNLLS